MAEKIRQAKISHKCQKCQNGLIENPIFARNVKVDRNGKKAKMPKHHNSKKAKKSRKSKNQKRNKA